MPTKYNLQRLTGPAAEPVSLAEARDHCEIIASDTSHDTKLNRFIAAAREQVENDTGYALITQTYTVTMTDFPAEFYFSIPMRPIQSVTSITYYDLGNEQQTLATSVYGLDMGRRLIYLKPDQSWPSTYDTHNGIVTTFVAGYGSGSAAVPLLFKQAVLLQIAKWFAHRGDEGAMYGRNTYDAAYEAIIARIGRTSYP